MTFSVNLLWLLVPWISLSPWRALIVCNSPPRHLGQLPCPTVSHMCSLSFQLNHKPCKGHGVCLRVCTLCLSGSAAVAGEQAPRIRQKGPWEPWVKSGTFILQWKKIHWGKSEPSWYVMMLLSCFLGPDDRNYGIVLLSTFLSGGNKRKGIFSRAELHKLRYASLRGGLLYVLFFQGFNFRTWPSARGKCAC